MSKCRAIFRSHKRLGSLKQVDQVGGIMNTKAHKKLLNVLLLSAFLLPFGASPVIGSENLVAQSQQKAWWNSNLLEDETFLRVEPEEIRVATGAAERTTWDSDKSGPTSSTCESFLKFPCDLQSRQSLGSSSIRASAGAAACSNEGELFCFESLELTAGGNRLKLTPIREFPTKKAFRGDAQNNIPNSGSELTLWLQAQTGDYFLSSAELNFVFDSQGELKVEALNVAIRRVAPRSSIKDLSPNAASFSCITSECWVEVRHNLNEQILATVRTPAEIPGWILGRSANTSVTPSRVGQYFRYIFAATPAEVPMLSRAVSKQLCAKDWCPDLISVSSVLGVNWEKAFGTGYSIDRKTMRSTYVTPSKSLTPWQALVKMADDKADGTRTLWAFQAGNFVNIDYGTNCSNPAGTIKGLFTSNAMIYSNYGPTIRGNGFFYRVAGLHYQKDGKTLATGTYELQVDSSLARCIFKLTKAPISATLSVIDDGQQRAVTGTTTESGGLLKISMSGFGFSMPELSVKIHQSKPTQTIKCVSRMKNTKPKFVTGQQPKCPKGYLKSN